MEAQFVDRILSCSDCHGEFIFTAGEQLFFHDKQFTNDPKRCKPCKSRRSGLAAAANGTGPAAAGLSRTETRTECSECGIETTVPFKPTQGRPVLCRQCFQSKNRSAAAVINRVQAPPQSPVRPQAMAAASGPSAETISALTHASVDINGGTMSASEALMAASSMASASPESSVASAADLASISGLDEHPSTGGIPTELLAAASSEEAPAQLVAARVESVEA